MANFNDRDFDLRFAAWKASRLLPRGKRQGDGVEAYAPFARALEAQLELAGYRIEKVGAAANAVRDRPKAGPGSA